MEGIQSCMPFCGRGADPPSIEFQGQSARLSCLNVCEQQSAEIAITTDEGDKVMLSAHQHAEATLLTYEHLVYDHAGYGWEEIELSDFTLDREIDLTIEGELNDQELADIQALLRDLGGMLQSFLTGGAGSDGLPAAAGGFNRFSTLSAFEADFECRTRVQYLNGEADRLAVPAPSKKRNPCAERLYPQESTNPPVAAPWKIAC